MSKPQTKNSVSTVAKKTYLRNSHALCCLDKCDDLRLAGYLSTLMHGDDLFGLLSANSLWTRFQDSGARCANTDRLTTLGQVTATHWQKNDEINSFVQSRGNRLIEI